MMLVLILAGALWGLGAYLRTPVQARLYMIGLLYVAVLFVQLALPGGHPLRESLGGSAEPWLILGGMVLAVLLYRAVFLRIRGRAQAAQAEREAPAPQPSSGPFTPVELERYARHIVLREIGGPGQRKLKAAKVLVVGAGGLGSPALLYLGAAGIGTIGVIDDDVVDLSNLQRQIIHTDDRTGQPKVFSAQAALAALNPHVTVRPYHRRLTPEIAEDLFSDYDLILDGSDSFATREIVNRAAVATGKPVVAGAITQWEGQITIYDPAGGAPCLACLFPEAPAPGLAPSCAEAGVVGALPGIVGSAMAMEAIKEITGAGTPLRGALLTWDGLDADARRIKVARRADCPVCGDI
ncbi:HesA/MoeB/ThiF family protein [Jannaschia seohaensis]|uniref:Molybdopterin-synthase adenylyltransferase n=1 Tax=Jannaschia seohaensis TaxID=475081 RepID=A0A2Y9AZ78_9RHOB|nr:molybdopterin-synthase adenylyltransferase MoeB [Jannaschia seohaensis]PWJ16166.1 molybdopterin/thiamine biosynthesis adenylyltransferase [Jannaschia seohaensis]SSA49165.1 Molybdopterin or thiamine biosynthesis adenylyltransferase [Jannaschia seohaensis]